MMRRRRSVTVWASAMALILVSAAGTARAQRQEGGGGAAPNGKQEFEGLTPETARELTRQYAALRRGRVAPMATPDIFGHGSVLNVGKVVQKVTNFGFNGNPFTNTSSDPSGQWPGQSGKEYLFAQTIAVGGVNPGVSPGDPVSRRRVSSGIEWRPPTLNPEDRIYPSYEGIANGKRFFNDDDDKDTRETITYLAERVDEDFQDGHDNDGDGHVDEDYGALGQQMYSFLMRDDTDEAIRFTQAEPHVPVGFEIKERAWAYSITALENFNVFEYDITNVSGHEIDSVYVAFPIDMDCGPVNISNYFIDDLDVPQFPSGDFAFKLNGTELQEPRLQISHDTAIDDAHPELAGKPLCPQLDIRINGFSIADDNGDEGKTDGVPSLLLIDYTIDPTGKNGPSRVGFRAFRSYAGGTPFTQGGPPRIDQQRFLFMSGRAGGDVSADPYENISPETGFIDAQGGDQKNDFAAWCSVGPWLSLLPNASISVTIAFAVQKGTYSEITKYPVDYAALKADSASNPQSYQTKQAELFSKYPALKNAYDAQVAFEGIWEARREGIPSTDWHGRETFIRGEHGSTPRLDVQDCRDQDDFDGRFRPINPDELTWFDFDCNYCTGVWKYVHETDPDKMYLTGMLHHTWNASAPPPNPALNTGINYNFTDNPNRVVAAAGDRRVNLAWDNLSQVSPDPGEISHARSVFDFRGYQIYKVAGWTRPVGSPGPAEDDWALLASYTWFNYRDSQGRWIPNNAIGKKPAPPNGDPGDTLIFPVVSVPACADSLGLPCREVIKLYRGDLWDRQSGRVLHPHLGFSLHPHAPATDSVPCIPGPYLADAQLDSCVRMNGCESKCGRSVFNTAWAETLIHYPVGLYRYEDNEVKNGFVYFYSVAAFDSSVDGVTAGRKSAVESEGVTPQASTVASGNGVWVVPNPYKGYEEIARRPSTWDLTPNATDPTGTHIDFMGLPPGQWTIRIYTVAGDLVQTLKSTDPVNQSLRSPVTTPTGTYPGYNRQQDTPNDGQARWNLISRNGQDVVSGIYIFTVDSSQGIQRGRFVVIR